MVDERRERRLVVPPAVQLDARRVIDLGVALFAVAFVALLPFWGWLGRHDHRIWLWTALAGTVLGLAGRTIVTRHRRMGRTR